MRLFIAIDLDNKEYFKAIHKNIDVENAKVNFTKSFHLTLKFLGEVDDSKVDHLKEALQKIKFSSFKVKTTKIGVFPNENYIRVVWVGLEPEDKLIQLKDFVDESLKGIFSKEKDAWKSGISGTADGGFKAHLTLARVKFLTDKTKFIESLKKIKFEQKEFEIKEIKLIKSTLTEEGPVYEDILKIKNS